MEEKSDGEPLQKENAARRNADMPERANATQRAEQSDKAEDAAPEPQIDRVVRSDVRETQTDSGESKPQKLDLQAERERALASLREQRRRASREITESSGESGPVLTKERSPIPGVVPPPRMADRRPYPPQSGTALPNKESGGVEISENGEARTALARERLEKLRAAREKAKQGGRTRTGIEIKEDEE
ncbi:MAG: hypothetical protein K2M95_02505, partial [Clostridiales bacterium]|nr:hypothetical protein [Clostridiales bacterium]